MPHNIDLHAVTGPGRRRASSLHGAGAPVAVHVQGAEPGPLRLPLRDGAGRHAHRQRHVRPDPRRAGGGLAPGGPRVLRDAGRLLHARRRTARRACSRSTCRRPSTRDPTYVVFNGARGRARRRQRAPGEGRRDASASSSATAGRTWCRRFHVIGEIFDRVYSEGGTPRTRRRADDARFPPAARPSSSSSSRCPAPTSWSTTRSSAPSTRARSACSRSSGPENKLDLLRQGGRRASTSATRRLREAMRRR